MQQRKYDVCVIGSGAAGGTLATALAQQGADVVLIEGGPYRDPAKLNTHAWPWERGRPQVPAVDVSLDHEPYLNVGDPVSIARARVLGGRTTHWNAVSLRFAPDDFREWSAAGIEEDWPISYDEIAPYYDRAERLMVALAGRKGETVGAPALRYINRLSDFLFVAARYANDKGNFDVLWVPGQNR